MLLGKPTGKGEAKPAMYMVVVTVNTPGWHAAATEVTKALNASTADADRLQHVYLETDFDRVGFSFYLQAANKPHAASLANQLCRRTMASVASSRRWSVNSLAVCP